MFNSKWERLFRLRLSSRQAREMFQDMSDEELAEFGLPASFPEAYFEMVWRFFRIFLVPQLIPVGIFVLTYIHGNPAMSVGASLLLVASFSLLAFVFPFIVFGVSAL